MRLGLFVEYLQAEKTNGCRNLAETCSTLDEVARTLTLLETNSVSVDDLEENPVQGWSLDPKALARSRTGLRNSPCQSLIPYRAGTRSKSRFNPPPIQRKIPITS